MQVSRIVEEIDAEIERLQQAKALLSGAGVKPVKRAAAERPAAKKAGKRKHRLSAEGRKRIADAMRRRWAERRKQLASK